MDIFNTSFRCGFIGGHATVTALNQERAINLLSKRVKKLGQKDLYIYEIVPVITTVEGVYIQADGDY
jgi:hypothetical protein